MHAKPCQSDTTKRMKRVLFLLAVLVVSGVAWSEASQEVSAQVTRTPVASCPSYYINDHCYCTGNTIFCYTPRPTPTPTPAEPLIFIPGIGGSNLKSDAGYELWLGGISTDRSRLSLEPGKPQANITAPDVIRQTTLAGRDVVVYQPLLQMLTTEGGYREYQVNNVPARRTTAGCDLSQKDSKPTLFIFAYDWRKSNVGNAAKLKDYVGCVQRFYPDSEVNLLTHSMGGYVARRYILDNPGAHNSNKMITIGTPWLGAPKAMYLLETGRFLEIGNIIVDPITDRLFSPFFKSLLEFFPGAHELLPSQKYFSLGGSLFGEANGKLRWDINRNGQLDTDYRPEELADLLDNIQFPRSKPARTGNTFHDNPGQDDWRNDQTGVQYYHFYGIQKSSQTRGKVLAVRYRGFDRQSNITEFDDYITQWVQGDGTVPLLSAERVGYGQNLNVPGATTRPFASPSANSAEEALVEHTGLTKNSKVWDAILVALKLKPQQAVLKLYRTTAPIMQKASYRRAQEQRSSQDQPTVVEGGEAYYLQIWGAENVVATDTSGNTSSQIEDTSFRNRLPGITVEGGLHHDDIVVPAELSTDESYIITFRSTGAPVEINITKGIGNARETATQFIGYLDLNLPAGVMLMLKVTSAGIEDLRYDADGDGTFESTIAPTASAIGAAARDGDAPAISFSEKVQGTKRLVSIIAEDQESGVRIVRYSLDGKKYQPYTAPLLVDAAQMPTVSVIADDNVANRSDTITYKPLLLAVAAARDSQTKEIVVTATIRNEGTGAVQTDFILTTAKLNNRATTTALPFSINAVAASETVTKTLRFPGTATASGKSAALSGSGTSQGEAFSGSVQVFVP